jgi:hypothetical protein
LDTGHFGYRHNPENFKNRENVMRKMILSNYIRFFEQWVCNENTTSRHMTYPISFSDMPALTISSAYQLGLYPYNESATGFDYKLASDGSSIGKNIMHGIAIGY